MSIALPARRALVLGDLLPGALVRDIGLVTGGAALTGLAAQVAIQTPWSPVPFTLQTLAVLVVGPALGSLRAVAAMLVYLLAGMAGVPWYAGHQHGWGGPSFGYVLGFVVAAGVTGHLARRGGDRHVLSTVALLVAGTAIVYAIGTAWLAADLGLAPSRALELGVRPFVGTDALKIGLASLAFPATWKVVNRSR
jgi:biotin transport system substrate-specific component